MNWTLLIPTYIVVWCLVLQAVLPFGVQRPKEFGAGHDHGAPDKAYWGIKIFVTTLIALLITLIIAWMAIHDTFHVKGSV